MLRSVFSLTVLTSAKQRYNQDALIESYRQLIRSMPEANQYLLLYVLDLLSVFARKADRNLMTAHSECVSIFFQATCPTLCRFGCDISTGDHIASNARNVATRTSVEPRSSRVSHRASRLVHSRYACSAEIPTRVAITSWRDEFNCVANYRRQWFVRLWWLETG